MGFTGYLRTKESNGLNVSELRCLVNFSSGLAAMARVCALEESGFMVLPVVQLVTVPSFHP